MTQNRGNSRGSAKIDAKRVTTAQKRDRALELRMRGLSMRAIAKEMGLTNPGSVHRLVNDAIESIPKENAQRHIRIELLKCDQDEAQARRILAANRAGAMEGLGAKRAMFARIVEGQQKAVDRICERRAKITGIYAAQKVEHTGAEGGAIPIEVTSASHDELLGRLSRLAAASGTNADSLKPDSSGGHEPPV